MEFDPEALSLQEMMRVQDELAAVLHRRFGQTLALCVTDMVASVEYFRRFGDVAGRAMQQRHFDLVHAAIAAHGGRLVDTAGDGAFFIFHDVVAAANALCAVQRGASEQNLLRPREHHLTIRGGLHWGFVLTDGAGVAGDSVNLCARVAGSGKEHGFQAEIRLTRAAYLELPPPMRVRCRALPPAPLKGVEQPIPLVALDWDDQSMFPTTVRCVETGQAWALPRRDVIGFGRIAEHEGVAANDIVLAGLDEHTTAKISRWHFELRRRADGFTLRALSDARTEVDGTAIAKGGEVPLPVGAQVTVSRVLTLSFSAPQEAIAGTRVPGSEPDAVT